MRSRDHRGYGAAVVGTLLGALLLGGAGLLLGKAYIQLWMPHAELEALIPLVIGLLSGILAGAMLGCWLLLRWRRYQAAWRTALVTGIFVLLVIPLYFLITISLHHLFELAGPAVSTSVLIILLIAAALLARLLTGRAQSDDIA